MIEIKKTELGYQVCSSKGRSFGTYPSLEKAETRLNQIVAFMGKYKRRWRRKAANENKMNIHDLADLFYKQAGLLKYPEQLYKHLCQITASVYANRVKSDVELNLKQNAIITGDREEGSEEDEKSELIELNLLKRICDKYILNYKFKDDKFEYNFNLAEHMGISPKSLDYISYDYDINFIIHNGVHPKMRGSWSDMTATINVYVSSENVFYVEEFKEELMQMFKTIRHELQHLIQTFETNKIELKQDFALNNNIQELQFGLPSKKIINPFVTPKGYSIFDSDENNETREKNKKEHSLRDVEFYTKLSDTILLFNYRKYPEIIKEQAARKFVGLPYENNFTDLNEQLIKNMTENYFFSALKKSQLEKWKKAVKEFWKAVFKD